MSTRRYIPRKPTASQKEAAMLFQSPVGRMNPQERSDYLRSPEGQAALTEDSLRALEEADQPTEKFLSTTRVFLDEVSSVLLREDQRRVADARAFMLAGNATFTVVSKATGVRFTFKVRASDTGTVHFVKVLCGPDNTSDYQYLGCIFQDGTYRQTSKSRISRDAPSAKAFEWFYRNIGSDKVEVYHEGRCCRCGRKLTVPSSIESGIGPECAGKM